MKTCQEYQREVANKLQMAREGGLFDSTMNVRDEEGIMQCFSRIIETAEHYYLEDPNRTRDPAIAMANFSQNQSVGSSLGVSGAANLATMDAMDISISTAVFSLIPYLAIERDMTSSSTNISYQDIVAEFKHGDLSAGEDVLGAFKAPNTKLTMGLPTVSGAVTAIEGDQDPRDEVIDLAVALMPETISVVMTQGSSVVSEGHDFNGKVWYSGDYAIDTVVDYKNGKITFKKLPAGIEVKASANIDSTSDETGKTILTVTPDYKNVILTAKPQQMLFKDNNLKNAYLNKLNIKLAGTNAQIDYGQVAVGKLISIYVHYVNRLVVNATIECGHITTMEENKAGIKQVTCDISGYNGFGAAGSFADTKYDYIKSFIIALNQRCLDITGKGMTAILTGSRGTNILASTPDFVKSADYQELNAMVGTYDGIPVIRHQNVNIVEPSDGKSAFIYGVFKDPSGSAAGVAFGEFLPVRVSDAVANYNNPEQVCRSLTSYCGVVKCVPSLVHLGVIKYLPDVDPKLKG
jgi:hypothetical protein